MRLSDISKYANAFAITFHNPLLEVRSQFLYCVGDQVTLADLCLVPQVYGAKRFNIELTDYPNVCRVNDELEKLPAFVKAHAHRQPDTPAELREA